MDSIETRRKKMEFLFKMAVISEYRKNYTAAEHFLEQAMAIEAQLG